MLCTLTLMLTIMDSPFALFHIVTMVYHTPNQAGLWTHFNVDNYGQSLSIIPHSHNGLPYTKSGRIMTLFSEYYLSVIFMRIICFWQSASKIPKKKVLAGGTVCEEVKEGHGPEAKSGKMVSTGFYCMQSHCMSSFSMYKCVRLD